MCEYDNGKSEDGCWGMLRDVEECVDVILVSRREGVGDAEEYVDMVLVSERVLRDVEECMDMILVNGRRVLVVLMRV